MTGFSSRINHLKITELGRDCHAFFNRLPARVRISPFSNVGNLGERSADILVGFGAFVNPRPTRMSALRKKSDAHPASRAVVIGVLSLAHGFSY